MSLAFRVFLIMLLAGLGLWGYRLRAPSLDRWLGRVFSAAEPAPETLRRSGGMVDTLPGLRLTLRYTSGGALPSPEVPGTPPDLRELEDVHDAFVLDQTDGFYQWSDPQPKPELPVLPGVQAGEQEPPYSVAAGDRRAPAGPALDGTYTEPPLPPTFADTLAEEALSLDDVEHGGTSSDDSTTGHVESDDSSAPDVEDGRVPLEPREMLIHVVASGDALWDIARAYYGTGLGYSFLVDANPELMAKRGEQVHVGDRILVPILESEEIEAERLKRGGSPVDKPVEKISEQSPEEPAADSGDSPAEVVLHRVERNETLSKIAIRYFPGDRSAWSRIFRANSETLASPDLVIEGMVLEIPQVGESE